MNELINRLINFSLQKNMIQEEDIDYSVNLLLDLFKLDSFEKIEIKEELEICTPILEEMLDYAISKNLLM